MKRGIVIGIIFLIVLIVLGYFLIPGFRNSETESNQEPQVADNSQETSQGTSNPNLVFEKDNAEFNGENSLDLSSEIDSIKNLEKGTIAFSFKFESLLDTQQVMPIMYFGADPSGSEDNYFVIEIGHSGGAGGEGSDSSPDPSNKKLYVTWAKNGMEPFLCFDTDFNLEENTEYNFAVVVDENGNTGYLDGVELEDRDYNFGSASASAFFADIPVKDVFYLGYGRSASMISPQPSYFKGEVSNLQIYNKALSSSEINELF